jgi:hypothetical protein
LNAGFELADDLVEVGRDPRVQVGQADGLSFLWVGGEVDAGEHDQGVVRDSELVEQVEQPAEVGVELE